MNKILIVLLILGTLLGQDKLITNGGYEYLGTYEGATEEVIYFIESNKTNVAGIPKTQISQVILEDGTVVFDKSTMPVPVSYDAITVPDTVMVNDYDKRQTKALERIAVAQTFFMYYLIAWTIIMIGALNP